MAGGGAVPGAGGSLRAVRQRHHGGHGLRRARGEGGRDLAGYVYSLLSANDSRTLHLALAILLFATCPLVLVSAGIELIFFLVAGTVLCFGFSVRIMLIATTKTSAS